MKVGDKIYCIKSNYGYLDFDNDNALLNEKGKFYKITSIGEFRIYVTCSTHHICEYIIKDTINEPEQYCNWLRGTFYDHFVTEKEYRKLKLEKINESNL